MKLQKRKYIKIKNYENIHLVVIFVKSIVYVAMDNYMFDQL